MVEQISTYIATQLSRPIFKEMTITPKKMPQNSEISQEYHFLLFKPYYSVKVLLKKVITLTMTNFVTFINGIRTLFPLIYILCPYLPKLTDL